MSSFLDGLIHGIRDLFDKDARQLPTRTALQFKGAVTVEDDEVAKRTIVTIGGDGGPTDLAGDVAGPAGATVVERIRGVPVAAGTPADGHVLTGEGGVAKWKAPAGGGDSTLLRVLEITLPTDTAPKDAIVFTTPECLAAVVSRVWIVVSAKLVGTGTVTARAGASEGGNGYIIDTPITSASEGIAAGENIDTLGARFPSANGYEAVCKTGDEIHVRLTASGTVTGGKVKVFVFGQVLT